MMKLVGKPGAVNGTTGTVTALSPHGVVVNTEDGPRHLDATYAAEHLTHSYAMTIHKPQGRTVDTTHVLLGDRAYRELAYVMLSRHREATAIYEASSDGPHLNHALDRERVQQLALHDLQSRTTTIDRGIER